MANTPRDPGEPVAEANELFRDNGSRRKPEVRPSAPAPIDSYEVEGLDTDDLPPIPRAPIAPKRPAKPRPTIDCEDSSEPKPEATVSEIWTRSAEWGPTLILVAGAFVASLVVAYFASDSIGLAILAVLVGIVFAILLSYPMAVTMERPVRMTPEQALKDFYAAASHHFPHFRRMWLLLSDEGRDSAEFSNYGTFRAYWKHRMAKLRGGEVGAMTPLMFNVVDFKSEKSAGATSVDAGYSISVVPRTDGASPVKEVRVETTFVRGPDKMWYLNLGILPES